MGSIFYSFHVDILNLSRIITLGNLLEHCPKIKESKLQSSTREVVFLGKGVLKICCKFTGEHPCRSAISIKFQSNFIEIALWHGCSFVNLLHIFRTPFHKKTYGELLKTDPLTDDSSETGSKFFQSNRSELHSLDIRVMYQ